MLRSLMQRVPLIFLVTRRKSGQVVALLELLMRNLTSYTASLRIQKNQSSWRAHQGTCLIRWNEKSRFGRFEMRQNISQALLIEQIVQEVQAATSPWKRSPSLGKKNKATPFAHH
jgi:hypothetical protein